MAGTLRAGRLWQSVAWARPLGVQRPLPAQRCASSLRTRASELGARWNAFSGYEAIEKLKGAVSSRERELERLREELQRRRQAYVGAVSERSGSQRQLSDLLSRKATWTEAELATYTGLLHSEHAQARAEKEAELAYEQAEETVQKAFDGLMRAITQRYHEEHVWSDRIRNVSTWASVGVAVLNVLVFTLAILLVEPYKRRKLAAVLEQRLAEGEAQNAERLARAIEGVGRQVAKMEGAVDSLRGGDASEPAARPAPPRQRQRQREVAVAGAVGVAVGLLAMLIQ